MDLGTATSFAVLAGSTVTSSGTSTISGDVGVSTGSAVTGLTAAMVTNGSIHRADAKAASAQAALTTAYNNAAQQSKTATITDDLGSKVLKPGVYSGATLGLTGTLTLDAQGVSSSVFVFQASSTLNVATAGRVQLINGANPCNVFWQVGSSATLEAGATFVGSVLALTSISVNTGTDVQGRLLARNGAVTLKDDNVALPQCGTSGGGGSTAPSTGSSSTSTGETSGTPGSSSPASPSSTATGTGTATGSGTGSTPTVGDVSPSSGPSGGGTTVTVSGTGFAGGSTTVALGGTRVPGSDVAVRSSTSLTFRTPAHAAGRWGLVVTTAVGSSNGSAVFTYRDSVTPSSTTLSSTTSLANTGTPVIPQLWIVAGLVSGGIVLTVSARRPVRARHRR